MGYYHIEVFTKTKIDYLIKNPNEANDNLIFTVMFSIIADLDIFDNPREESIEWFSENKDNFVENDDSASYRGCTEDVVCAPQPVAITSNTGITFSSNVNCITIVNCDTGGGDNSCQECGGGGGTGGASSGGGSGSGSAYPVLESMLTVQQFNTLKSYHLNSSEMNLLENLFKRGMFAEELNPCEEELIIRSPNHAVCAGIIYSNSITASQNERMRFGFNGWNDCGDAFRHAHWNALNTKTCGAAIAREFGDAHECDNAGNPPRVTPETTMDLNNNQAGRNIAVNNLSTAHGDFDDLVCTELQNGQLTVLTNPRNPNSWPTTSAGCTCN